MLYFASLWCDLQRNYLGESFCSIFGTVVQIGVRINYLYENPLQFKFFTKIIVSKFIKVSSFNENKHKGMNKCFYL